MRNITVEITPTTDPHITPAVMVNIRVDGQHHASIVVDTIAEAATAAAAIITTTIPHDR